LGGGEGKVHLRTLSYVKRREGTKIAEKLKPARIRLGGGQLFHVPEMAAGMYGKMPAALSAKGGGFLTSYAIPVGNGGIRQ